MSVDHEDYKDRLLGAMELQIEELRQQLTYCERERKTYKAFIDSIDGRIKQVISENVRLYDQLATFSKDAERYRWLRGETYSRWVKLVKDNQTCDELDACIDGAICEEMK